MKKKYLLLVFFVMLFACKPGIPENIIPPDKMGKVLVDIHIVDGYISTIVAQDSAKRMAAKYYQTVYKKHQIDSVKYNRSLNYYYKNPNILAKIYEGVSADLDKKKKLEEGQGTHFKIIE